MVTNTAEIQSFVSLQTSRAYLSSPGDSFMILTNVNGPSSPFDEALAGGTYDLNGANTYVRYDGGTGDDMTLTIDAVPTASARRCGAA